MIDLIALRFGFICDGGGGEDWHFEMTNVEASKSNEKFLKPEKTNSLVASISLSNFDLILMLGE